ncbi:hypothetical protein Tco_1101528 [Tanacetum coccineum]
MRLEESLNLLKKGLLVQGERFPMSQRTILAAQAAHFSRSDDEVQDVSSDEENKADDNKADAEVAEKQA